MTTSMVATRLVLLTIARSSPGGMWQESSGPSLVSLPPMVTVTSPSTTTYTRSNGEAEFSAPPPGRK